METLNPQIEQHTNPSFLAKYKFTIISLCIILLALIPLIMISRNTKKPMTQSVAQQVVVTPTLAPLTQQNAAPTLDAVDTKMQAALDQSNTDLQQAAQVDSSQDNTTGF